MTDSLLIVAIKTDQPDIARRMTTILAAAQPVEGDTQPVAWAKAVDDLVAADLDALAALVGWEAVSRLRVGDVSVSGLAKAPVASGIRDGSDSDTAQSSGGGGAK